MPITLFNKTKFDAQYLVLKGEQVIAALPATPPNGSVVIPTTNIYTVSASTTIDGNVYTSALLKVTSGKGFRALVKQDTKQQTYVFEVIDIPSSKPNELQFEKTCNTDVVFTIFKGTVPLQPIALTNAFMQSGLLLSDTYSISAVINGVTTDITTTNDENANITAVNDTASAYIGYHTLLTSN